MIRQLSGVFPPTCMAQWSGQPEALRKFLRNGLPHEVEGVVALCTPLRMIKELQASVGLLFFLVVSNPLSIQVVVQTRTDMGEAVEIPASKKKARKAPEDGQPKQNSNKKAKKVIEPAAA